MCLSPTETRYQSSGELRRELGKLLFSGPYAPSTFNLAFYLSGLFGVEIEAENRGRAEEASLDAGSIPEVGVPSPSETRAAAGRQPRTRSGPGGKSTPAGGKAEARAAAAGDLAAGGRGRGRRRLGHSSPLEPAASRRHPHAAAVASSAGHPDARACRPSPPTR